MIAAVALLAAGSLADPRIHLVELQLQDRNRAALEVIDQSRAEDPDRASELGYDYLEGHLLELLGRASEAHRAFARALSSTPRLSDFSRYRLALNVSRGGHPEVAAGLLAKLLSTGPPDSLVRPATDLLVRSLGSGGECGLLDGLETWRLPQAERRKLQLARADCALRGGRPQVAGELLIEIVRGEPKDEPGREAAERIDARLARLAVDPQVSLLLGQAFHRHRQFDLSIRYFVRGLGQQLLPTAGTPSRGELEALYELARGHFWRGEYLLAASRFGQLASRLADHRERGRPLYQQGRCYELNGNWDLASKSYRLAFMADPAGEWAGTALLAALRIEWRLGSEDSALELYELLGSERKWLGLFSRGALFLSSSDLVRGRTDRAGGWLDDSARWRHASPAEIRFWKGRLAELEGRAADAVAHYQTALLHDRFDPLAAAAGQRLARPELATLAGARGRRQAGSRSPRDLYGAWLLLGDADPDGARARRELERRLRADARARGFLDIASPPPAEWPLWRSSLDQPEEMLLALGVWSQGSAAMLKHFPVSDAALGLTASRLLAHAHENRRSLYVAEILGRRTPASVPSHLVSPELRGLLFPLPYRDLIYRESQAHGVDPFLLAAIIREESRFDPNAVSAASARGLTQFVLPTARRLAGRLGIENLAAADLHEPAVAIALGSAYLAELAESFDGDTHSLVAAYNAGESQAQLWRSHCYSLDPAEYFTKVSFAETRQYLRKVLSSWGQYREIYGE